MARPRKRRLDEELVANGFFHTRDEALRAVMAGEVSTSDRRLERAGEQVVPGIELHVRGRGRFVSRGGLKLEGGLDHFGLDVDGLSCLDVGCSTGGFTDCLLTRGAASVCAVDVGYAQFDWGLRTDGRVTLFERTNVCDLPALVGEATFDLAVSDVSFTSVLTIAPAVLQLLRPGGTFLTLVKPQFEAAREDVGPKGVVTDEAIRRACVDRVGRGLTDLGFAVQGVCDSPIKGAKGNREYLLLALR